MTHKNKSNHAYWYLGRFVSQFPKKQFWCIFLSDSKTDVLVFRVKLNFFLGSLLSRQAYNRIAWYSDVRLSDDGTDCPMWKSDNHWTSAVHGSPRMQSKYRHFRSLWASQRVLSKLRSKIWDSASAVNESPPKHPDIRTPLVAKNE